MLLWSYGLAERLGMLHADMMERITAEELAYWLARDQISLPDSWYQAATIAYAAANAFGKGPKFKDFLPKRKNMKFEMEPATAEEWQAAFDAL